MGEPAAAGAATSERDVLLATKLNVPGLRPDLVPRPRLAQRLDEGRGGGLVLACAPAGYGKTVLLAEWARRGRHPVAWLSLDAGDCSPTCSAPACRPNSPAGFPGCTGTRPPGTPSAAWPMTRSGTRSPPAR